MELLLETSADNKENKFYLGYIPKSLSVVKRNYKPSQVKKWYILKISYKMLKQD
jgi:hypothetical protein